MDGVSVFQCPGRIIMGTGALDHLPEEIERVGGRRIVVITDPGVAASPSLRMVERVLGDAGIRYDLFDDVIPEPPFEVLDRSTRFARAFRADLIVGFGGGSSMDTAKGTALLLTNGGDPRSYTGVNLVPKPGLPVILMPTTAGTSSEVTNIAIFKDRTEKLKKGIVTDFNYCKAAILDPRLTLSVPSDVTAATGMDALIHALECYISVRATEITDAFALKAISYYRTYLPRACRDGDDLEARMKMQEACLMSGLSFGNAGVCGVHALSYPLGGRFDVPHGISNTLMMLPVLKFNRPACPERYRDIAEALGVDCEGKSSDEAGAEALDLLAELAREVRVPTKLREEGIPEESLEDLADNAIKVTRLLANNPRPITREDALQLYREAH